MANQQSYPKHLLESTRVREGVLQLRSSKAKDLKEDVDGKVLERAINQWARKKELVVPTLHMIVDKERVCVGGAKWAIKYEVELEGDQLSAFDALIEEGIANKALKLIRGPPTSSTVPGQARDDKEAPVPTQPQTRPPQAQGTKRTRSRATIGNKNKQPRNATDDNAPNPQVQAGAAQGAAQSTSRTTRSNAATAREADVRRGPVKGVDVPNNSKSKSSIKLEQLMAKSNILLAQQLAAGVQKDNEIGGNVDVDEAHKVDHPAAPEPGPAPAKSALTRTPAASDEASPSHAGSNTSDGKLVHVPAELLDADGEGVEDQLYDREQWVWDGRQAEKETLSAKHAEYDDQITDDEYARDAALWLQHVALFREADQGQDEESENDIRTTPEASPAASNNFPTPSDEAPYTPSNDVAPPASSNSTPLHPLPPASSALPAWPTKFIIPMNDDLPLPQGEVEPQVLASFLHSVCAPPPYPYYAYGPVPHAQPFFHPDVDRHAFATGIRNGPASHVPFARDPFPYHGPYPEQPRNSSASGDAGVRHRGRKRPRTPSSSAGPPTKRVHWEGDVGVDGLDAMEGLAAWHGGGRD